jgi:hypothetical protein
MSTTQSHLARTLALARRTAIDLKLLRDSADAARLPDDQQARIRRARAEMSDLIEELEATTK